MIHAFRHSDASSSLKFLLCLPITWFSSVLSNLHHLCGFELGRPNRRAKANASVGSRSNLLENVHSKSKTFQKANLLRKSSGFKPYMLHQVCCQSDSRARKVLQVLIASVKALNFDCPKLRASIADPLSTQSFRKSFLLFILLTQRAVFADQKQLRICVTFLSSIEKLWMG